VDEWSRCDVCGEATGCSASETDTPGNRVLENAGVDDLVFAIVNGRGPTHAGVSLGTRGLLLFPINGKVAGIETGRLAWLAIGSSCGLVLPDSCGILQDFFYRSLVLGGFCISPAHEYTVRGGICKNLRDGSSVHLASWGMAAPAAQTASNPLLIVAYRCSRCSIG